MRKIRLAITFSVVWWETIVLGIALLLPFLLGLENCPVTAKFVLEITIIAHVRTFFIFPWLLFFATVISCTGER